MRYPGDKRSPDKLLSIGGSAAGEVTSPGAHPNPADGKRADGRSAPSQPEEIFSAPADEGYDEYPVSQVPKKIINNKVSAWVVLLNPYHLTHNL